MAVADPPRVAPAHRDHAGSPHRPRKHPTSPLRIYTADQQPIRLLAELQGIGPAELVHRALVLFVRAHREELTRVTSASQQAFEVGDYERLVMALEGSAHVARARLAAELDDLSSPPEEP